LADYVDLRDVNLRKSLEAEHGLFMAEGDKVIRRALRAGFEPRSLLLTERRRAALDGALDGVDAPLYVVSEEVARGLVGFHLHRGALASSRGRPLPTPAEVLRGARTAVVLEDVVDHTNVGGPKPPQAGDLSSDTSRTWQRDVAKSEVNDTFELSSGVSSDQEWRRTAVPGDSLESRGDRSVSNTKRRSRIG